MGWIATSNARDRGCQREMIYWPWKYGMVRWRLDCTSYQVRLGDLEDKTIHLLMTHWKHAMVDSHTPESLHAHANKVGERERSSQKKNYFFSRTYPISSCQTRVSMSYQCRFRQHTFVTLDHESIGLVTQNCFRINVVVTITVETMKPCPLFHTPHDISHSHLVSFTMSMQKANVQFYNKWFVQIRVV